MKKIKSVDFKITASGFGVINYNGSYPMFNPIIQEKVSNHLLPKMRGVDPFELDSFDSPAFQDAKLIISQNSVRHALFRQENYNLLSINKDNIDQVLCSLLGLIRGYVVAEKGMSAKRKSCLLLEDFVDHDAKMRFEQLSCEGARDKTSIFSKHTTDETHYTAYGSISIEDLQFIVLDNKYDRSNIPRAITKEYGEELADKMTKFIKTLSTNNKQKPLAEFHSNYVRTGSIMNDGEAGILLNDDAIDIIVKEMLDRLENCQIHKSKGFMTVDSILVDYNTGKGMRIKHDETLINTEKNDAIYFCYFEKK